MNKKTYLLLSILILVISLHQACHLPPKVKSEFPPAMLEHVKKDYAEQWEKGRILYQINCAGCHSKKKMGREIIPDFTPEQLEVYQIRVTNAQHETSVSEERVPAEELSYILIFLTYKTKSGYTIKSARPAGSH